MAANYKWREITAIWLFAWCKLGKVFFLIRKYFCSMHFNPFCTVFIILDSYDNHDLSSNDRISHREKIIILTKRHWGYKREMRQPAREYKVTWKEPQINLLPHLHHYNPMKTSLYWKTYAFTFDLGNPLPQT